MGIKEALLRELCIRLSNSNGRWLVIDELYRLGGEFVVYERQYAKRTTEVYRGTDEEEAVKALLNKEEE